tara:strand:+ start:415 stop:744 length:330 start_codon:yes stop_codon:yes gene_type:complete
LKQTRSFHNIVDDGSEWIFNNLSDAYCRCKVVGLKKGFARLISQPLFDRRTNQFNFRVDGNLMLQTCGEIVNNKDRVPLVKQVLYEVGPDESGTSSDKDSRHVVQATSE